ncbi:hypothetical protein GF314_17660 [bacterium]|nr:hypothetical protein [bacterium]
MLSIEECRLLLGPDVDLSDEEIEQLRDHLYSLADGIAELFQSHVPGTPTEPVEPEGR